MLMGSSRQTSKAWVWEKKNAKSQWLDDYPGCLHSSQNGGWHRWKVTLAFARTSVRDIHESSRSCVTGDIVLERPQDEKNEGYGELLDLDSMTVLGLAIKWYQELRTQNEKATKLYIDGKINGKSSHSSTAFAPYYPAV